MANLGAGAFDPGTVDPSAGGERLRDGEFWFQAVDSDYAPNAKGTGQVATFKLEVLDDGPDKGRNAWITFNLEHTNPKVVEIAQREMEAFRLACGVMEKVVDTSQLHYKPFRGKWGGQRNDATRGEMKKFHYDEQAQQQAAPVHPNHPASTAPQPAPQAQPPQPAPQTQPPQPAPQAAPAGKMPWE